MKQYNQNISTVTRSKTRSINNYTHNISPYILNNLNDRSLLTEQKTLLHK
ncbi:hypothetical protein ECH_0936 [Ehrlichia chaffeensis str. Arkansas]|uniref:Uncharacterized protein n=1 Tax=Ehrlichia chaffeensis (strain ATCC CRL-10679 / Arkansas) TaxID=205920 RepID=Q2GFQ8_EHRCR|nr:hypothetical protein ECH_0936 [Ehrlichia chaffeensis str. Arkansas]